MLQKLSLFLTLLTIFSCRPKILPKAVNGVLDLRPVTNRHAYSLQDDGILNLDGEWEFYWKEFLEPIIPVGAKNFIHVPGIWNGHHTGTDLIGSDGYATYRLKILFANNKDIHSLPEKKIDGLSLLLPTIATSYKLYVNGRLLTKVGDLEKAKPAYLTQIVRLPETSSGEYEIIFHIANYHYRAGGLWRSLQMGRDSDINRLREQNLFIDFFLIGSIFIIGLYHMIPWLLRRKDKSPLWFGIFCLLIAMRILVTGQFALYSFFPGLAFVTGIRIEYISWFLAIPAFILFTRTLFPEESKKLPLDLTQNFFYVSVIPVLLLPTSIFTYMALPMEIATLLAMTLGLYILIRAWQNKREGSIPFLIGFILLILLFINDILYSNYLIYTGFYFPYALLVYIFSQAFLLSSRFTHAFTQVEELSETLEKKVTSRTKQLELAKAKAEEANTLKDKFVGLISHDLRSPISGVHHILQMLAVRYTGSENKELGDLLLMSEKSLALSLQMVEQVLDITRMQSGKILPIFVKTNLAQIVSAVLAKISFKADEKGIKIANSIPEEVFLFADPMLLGQILLNVISNAIKFSRSNDVTPTTPLSRALPCTTRLDHGSIVELKYCQKEQKHIIEIIDNGTGIHEKLLPNLFDSTIRTSAIGTAGEIGSGLGLPLSYEMALAMNGNIAVRSVRGQGSVFTISLPAFEKIIFIVDDNEVWRKNFIEILKNENILIQQAENGEAALQILEKLKPDLIITDIHMPIMDGFALIKKIGANPEWKNIPVIVASSGNLGEQEDLELSNESLFSIGASEVIIKPVDKEKFISVIRKYLQNSP